MLEIPLITGKAAIFGLIGLATFYYVSKRPTVAITGAVLTAGVSTLF